MFEGIAFMHDHRIMHRDLKTSNLLVDADGLVKIADFGLGRLYREGQGLTPTVATLNYRAPELHFGVIDYSHTMDVWSAGCIMAELFIKRPLFTGSSEVAHLQKVCNILGIPNDEVFPGVFKLPKVKEALRQLSSWNREPKLGETLRGGGGSSTTDDAASLTDAGLDLFQKIFQWCPARRPSARDVLRHPFFTTEEPLPCSPSELVRPIPVAIQHTHASAPSDNTQSSSSTRHHARQQRNSGGSAPPPLVHHGDDGDVQKDGGSVVSGDAKRAEVEDREDSHSRVEVEEGTEDCASPFELSNTRSNPPTTTA